VKTMLKKAPEPQLRGLRTTRGAIRTAPKRCVATHGDFPSSKECRLAKSSNAGLQTEGVPVAANAASLISSRDEKNAAVAGDLRCGLVVAVREGTGARTVWNPATGSR